MPDRAVVDETKYERCLRVAEEEAAAGGQWYGFTCEAYKTVDDGERERQCAKPAPRAIVALSPDRQWLVVDQGDVFAVYEAIVNGFRVVNDIIEPGQDAHEVLAAFLAGHEASRS